MEADDLTPPAPAPVPELGSDAVERLLARVRDATVVAPTPVLGRIAELRTPTRVALVVVLQVVIAMASLALQGVRADLPAELVPRFVAQIGLFGVLALIVAAMALRPLHRAPPSGAVRALMLAPLLPVAAALTPGLWPGMDMPFWDAMPVHVSCLLWSSATSALAMLPFVFADRLGLDRRWSFVAAAGTAGTLGFVVQMSNCPLIAVEHLAISHAFGGVTVAAVFSLGLWLWSRRRA